MSLDDAQDREPLLQSIQSGTWEDYLQTLHRYFFEHHQSRCLVWINPAQGDPFSEVALEDQKIVVPIEHPRFDRKFGPYLIYLQLDKFSDAEIFKLSVEMAWEAWSVPNLAARAGQPICGWIGLDGDLNKLSEHWAKRCHVHFVGNRQKFLRFHDPGVRELLWTFLTPVQKTILTANTSAIFSIGRQQNLLKQTAPEMRPTFGSSGPSLVLDSIQWSYVADLANIHAASVLLQTEVGKSFDELPVGMSIFRALEHATRYGILDESNRQLFIRHVLEAGSEFHHDDRLKKVWPLTQSGEFYGVALEDILKCEPDQFKNHLLRHFA